jgi:hypothetical protein
MNQVYEGWIPKSQLNDPVFEWDDCEDNIANYGTHFLIFYRNFEISQKKGRRANYMDGDYPPVKIRITIESID